MTRKTWQIGNTTATNFSSSIAYQRKFDCRRFDKLGWSSRSDNWSAENLSLASQSLS